MAKIQKKQRVLLLTAAYGTGHDMAMAGVATALKEHGMLIDSLDLVRSGSFAEQLTAKWNIWAVRHFRPAWRLAYPNRITASQIARRCYRLYYRNKFHDKIAAKAPDIIIANHYLPIVVGSLYTERHPNVKLFAVVTDYESHVLWTWPHVTAYFVGLAETKQQLIQFGIPKNQVVVSGIPIRSAFASLPTKSNARKKLLIPQNRKAVLLSADTYNSTPIGLVLQRLLQDPAIFICILAGKEQDAFIYYQHLLTKLGLDGAVYPFVDYVERVMVAADICVTKAGGITVAEALACGLPCIFLNNLYGQEAGNARILREHGAAVLAENATDAAEKLLCLLENDSTRTKMSLRARALSNPNASQVIADTIVAQPSPKLGDRIHD